MLLDSLSFLVTGDEDLILRRANQMISKHHANTDGPATSLQHFYRSSVQSGKRNERPELEQALAVCKRHKAKLVIAKLDRLSRNLAFIATLMDSGVEFIAVDNPHANKLTIHILAAVAQHEREMIAQRTEDALLAAKARGVTLGNPKLADVRDRAVASVKADADRFAKNVAPIIREIQSSGVTSHRGVAPALNSRGIATARGGEWTAVQVGSILRRVV